MPIVCVEIFTTSSFLLLGRVSFSEQFRLRQLHFQPKVSYTVQFDLIFRLNFSEIMNRLNFSEIMNRLNFSEIIFLNRLNFSEIMNRLNFSEIMNRLNFSEIMNR